MIPRKLTKVKISKQLKNLKQKKILKEISEDVIVKDFFAWFHQKLEQTVTL